MFGYKELDSDHNHDFTNPEEGSSGVPKRKRYISNII